MAVSNGIFQRRLLSLAIVLSGFASLGYQIVWSKRLAVGIGLEGPAILAMITAFMGGFAIGAFLLNSKIQSSDAPQKWLIRLEAVIAIWGGISIAITPFIPQLIDAFGLESQLHHWITFIASLVLFAPATIAMGATLPAMERTWTAQPGGRPQIGLIYALNTFGATTGVLGTTFVLIPALGLQLSLVTLSCISATLAVSLQLTLGSSPSTHVSTPLSTSPPDKATPFVQVLFWLGFLGMGLQVMGTRVLAHFLDNTVFSYASILAVYLCGTSLGSYFFQWKANSTSFPKHASWIPFALTAGLILACLFTIPQLPALSDRLAAWNDGHAWQWIVTELCLASLLLLGPVVGSGFLFSAHIHQIRRQGHAIGFPLGWNLLGATIAPVIFYYLTPLAGTRNLLLGIALGYSIAHRPPTLRLQAAALSIALIVFWLAPSNRTLLGLPPDESVSFVEAPAGTISIHHLPDGNKHLAVNNHFMMGGTKASTLEQRQAHLPLLIHPRPQSALFLGLGTGITLGAATHHPELRADAVELVPEIIDQLEVFADWNQFPFEKSRVNVTAIDARRYIRTSKKKYDVIIADVFHPARDGASLLYTQDHFQDVKSRLNPEGLFCQWLPLHQLDSTSLRCLKHTFEAVFEHASAWLLDHEISLPVVAFIGSLQPLSDLSNRLIEIEQNSPLGAALKRAKLHNVNRVASAFLADFEQLDQIPMTVPINTDDRQFLTYYLPHRETGKPPANLLSYFIPAGLEQNPQLTTPPYLLNSRQPFEPLLRSRNHYLRGQQAESRKDVRTAISHYLEGIKATPQFTLNYARCIQIATLFAQENPGFSIQILESLVTLHPTETLAKKILERIRE